MEGSKKPRFPPRRRGRHRRAQPIPLARPHGLSTYAAAPTHFFPASQSSSEGSTLKPNDRSKNGAMAQEVSELLKKALALPAGARAALASSLLESLDDAVDASVEEEWNKRSLELALHCRCWPFLTDIGAPAIGRGGPEGNRSIFLLRITLLFQPHSFWSKRNHSRRQVAKHGNPAQQAQLPRDIP